MEGGEAVRWRVEAGELDNRGGGWRLVEVEGLCRV